MSRKLKFRAWDTKNEQYIKHVPNREYMIDSDEWDHHDMDGDGGIYPDYTFTHYALGGRIIFQQFTELKDSEGTEIYEGDWVETIYPDQYPFGEVYYDDGVGAFRIKCKTLDGTNVHLLPIVTYRFVDEKPSGLLPVVKKVLGQSAEFTSTLK